VIELSIDDSLKLFLMDHNDLHDPSIQ